jgi:proteasome lid subunit RPN8/RPN11
MSIAPHEACGIVTVHHKGKYQVLQFNGLANREPAVHEFRISMRDIRTLLESDIQPQHAHMWGFFHSHPGGLTSLSSADLKTAHRPDLKGLGWIVCVPERRILHVYSWVGRRLRRVRPRLI